MDDFGELRQKRRPLKYDGHSYVCANSGIRQRRCRIHESNRIALVADATSIGGDDDSRFARTRASSTRRKMDAPQPHTAWTFRCWGFRTWFRW